MHVAKELVSYIHKLTHLSSKKMGTFLGRLEINSYIPKRDNLIQQITGTCKACAQVNANRMNRPPGL